MVKLLVCSTATISSNESSIQSETKCSKIRILKQVILTCAMRPEEILSRQPLAIPEDSSS